MARFANGRGWALALSRQAVDQDQYPDHRQLKSKLGKLESISNTFVSNYMQCFEIRGKSSTAF